MIGKETHELIAKDSSGSREHFSKRIMILKISMVVCLGIAATFYGVRILSEGPGESAATERKDTMSVATQNSVANQSMIPPIDLSAPAKTETATFALG